MPTDILRTCAHPRCNRPVARGRCPQHRLRDADRPNADVRQWYQTPEWRALRAQVLAEEPRCAAAGCDRRSLHADHKVPHRGNAALFWNRGNLQGLCATHHSQKTRRGE